jgi:hypothetical protein
LTALNLLQRPGSRPVPMMPKLSPFSRLGAFAVLTLVALVASGCGGAQLDSRTGGDGVRDQAMGLFVNESSITDGLDGDDGDNTDWRYVDVTDEGRLTVTVSVDKPEQLGGAEVSLHDEFGGRLERQLVAGNRGTFTFAQEVEKSPTRFFVRIFAEGGRSSYSVGAMQSIRPSKVVAPPPVVVAPPPEVEPEPPPRRTARRQPRKRATPKPNVVVTPPPMRAEPVAPPPSAVAIEGFVTRVIAGKNNESCELTIRLTGGNVAKGQRGDLVRGGEVLERVVVTRASGSNLSATVPLPPGKLTGSLRVRFR